MKNLTAALLVSMARLVADAGGQVAVTFGICSLMLITAIGGGLDLAHAYVARQQLSHAATLTCQYSTRPAVLSTVYQGGSGVATYIAKVKSSSSVFLTSQQFPLTQTVAAPFVYSPGGASTVTLKAVMPTNFLGIMGLSNIPVAVTVNCSANGTEVSETQSTNVFTEGFESAACTGTCWGSFEANGQVNAAPSMPTNAFQLKAAYVGSTNTEWSVMGYCLEVDSVGIISPTVPEGTHSAELDCDNGSGSAGNSSISNRNYYAAGTYELRYYYTGRVNYPNYSPMYICGSTGADVNWANDTMTSSGAALRTNQINVYFDQDVNGQPPTHTTIDGAQTLAGSNLVDVCVYSSSWIERSVKITVTTAGYYWTSFAADGANDSYGGQIDAIQLCRSSCTGSVVDNFPGAWTSNGALFEDSFDSPTYTASPSASGMNTTATLNASYGVTGSSPSGWPAQTATGWAIAPYNQIDYLTKFSDQGAQSLQLDGVQSNGQSTSNRTMSRPFYLDPGYYEVDYDYISDFLFSSFSATYCVAAPPAGYLAYYNVSGSASGNLRVTGASATDAEDTNGLALFMSHSQMASFPTMGGAYNSTTSFTNPDGTTSTTPAVPPDALNMTTYDGTQVNPVLDYCIFSSSWTKRTTYIRITKPGQYWLTFAGRGTADGVGPAVDDVRLKALNSLYGSAPSFYVTIPTPSAAPGSTLSFTGFSITADPLTP